MSKARSNDFDGVEVPGIVQVPGTSCSAVESDLLLGRCNDSPRNNAVIAVNQVLTKDSVTVSVDAVVYYRVSNATISVANVENAHHSTRLLAQTTLRNTLGTRPLHEILSDRDVISSTMQVRIILYMYLISSTMQVRILLIYVPYLQYHAGQDHSLYVPYIQYHAGQDPSLYVPYLQYHAGQDHSLYVPYLQYHAGQDPSLYVPYLQYHAENMVVQVHILLLIQPIVNIVMCVHSKDCRLPVQLQRAMAAEAEAAREARAKVIAAEGEQKASRALREASEVIGDSPAALQLRYLQTLNTISAEKNSTIVFPLPIDLLTYFIKAKEASDKNK
uniref:Band 7 domain-containing protein n=2 Tax=Timema TaxID=61471 RepID=A0A7R9IFP5_9NEOP|nr:unnamed protein product [Timema tahoe]